MKLHQFALLTDENIHPRVVASLRTRGFDVLDVQELGSLQALLNRNLDLFPPFVVVAKRTGHSVTIRVRNLGPDRR